MIKIAPSVLSADFGKLGEELKAIEAAGADLVHIDVMDGRYVPSITVGAGVVRSLRAYTALPFDVHLMVESADEQVHAFADVIGEGGCISFHPHTVRHPHRLLQTIKKFSLMAGVVLNPGQGPESIAPLLDQVDRVMVMTVNPGFAGQAFIESQLKVISSLRALILRDGLSFEIAVDGGVSPQTAPRCVQAGASVLIAGQSVFGQPSYKEAIDAIRKACTTQS